MDIVLQIDGRERRFSENELAKIIKDYFCIIRAGKGILDGEWFEVKPQSINQELFRNKRKDKLQEQTRRYILEAFEQMNDYPEKYGRNFKTMMPRKSWGYKTVRELKEIASTLGDGTADFTEQCLEWAQRITNGESWESLCNEPDTANWFRMVEWTDVSVKSIGGSAKLDFSTPACDVSESTKNDDYEMSYTVPLVIKHE